MPRAAIVWQFGRVGVLVIEIERRDTPSFLFGHTPPPKVCLSTHDVARNRRDAVVVGNAGLRLSVVSATDFQLHATVGCWRLRMMTSFLACAKISHGRLGLAPVANAH
jgi:hypothetical protein